MRTKKLLSVVCLVWLAGQAAHAAEILPPEPCKAGTENAALGLVEVVELALCGNPQTREMWANARYQEAQLAISQAAYRPTVNATASVARAWNDRDGVVSPVDTKSAAVTLSYLLYDFGGRSATLENARQLLAAAIATQDSTVQAVFLSAVQAFYQVQAAEATLASAKEAERSSQESLKAATLRYSVGSGAPADKL
jgi:outer membrane protein TolC